MGWISKKQVDKWFEHSDKPTAEQTAKLAAIRSEAKTLALLILDLCPECADQSAAIRSLRECVANAAEAIRLGVI